jgi:hypothetical protein
VRHATGWVLLSLCACGPQAFVDAHPSEDGLVELRHDLVVHFEDGQVRLAVTREVYNATSAEQSFTRRIDLPAGAIVTSLRMGRQNEPMARAPLSTIEQVAAEWERLTGPGDAEPAPIGKLEWLFDGALTLEVFAVLPGETVTVGYDVQVDPRYEAGVMTVEFPRSDEGLPPRFERADVEATDDGFILRRQHHTQPVADVRWATAPLATARVLWRFEVDAAPELEPLPVAPRIVFVLDASHSEGPDGLAAQLELLAPLLSNVPDAQVEVVVTRHFAERLFGRFVPVSEVSALVTQHAARLVPGNGSNLEQGLLLAASALVGQNGPTRIIAFTDEALRTTFSNDDALDGLSIAPTGTVVHLVFRSGGGSGPLEESRDDEGALSPIASASGGVLFRVDGHATDPKASADTLLSLVRPVRVDGFHVEASGLEVAVESSLPEGTMVRLHGLAEQPPEFVTLTGKVWGRPFHRVVGTDLSLARRLPGLAVGLSELRLQLEDDELRSAAFLAQAVSPVTAYLAAPPRAAPSRVGVPGLGLGGIGIGSCGCGGSFSSTCGIGRGVPGVDRRALLEEALAPGRAACADRLAVPASGQLTVETTSDEVVDVRVTAASDAMAECLTEAAWALRLSPQFQRDASNRTWHLAW